MKPKKKDTDETQKDTDETHKAVTQFARCFIEQGIQSERKRVCEIIAEEHKTWGNVKEIDLAFETILAKINSEKTA